jgi:hypothetical protein
MNERHEPPDARYRNSRGRICADDRPGAIDTATGLTVGQRVRFTSEARRRFPTRRPGTGTVVAVNGLREKIRVVRDGTKKGTDYHRSFWEADDE